jgi:uncharacterized membrane protein YfcA
MITLSCVLRLIFYRKAGLLGGIPWQQAIWLILPLSLAIWLGHLTLQKVAPQRMRQVIFAFIAVSGVYYLVLH